jgi:hypothetical protein
VLAQPNAHHRPAVPVAHDRRRGPPLLVPHLLQGNRHRCSKPRASRGAPLRMAPLGRNSFQWHQPAPVHPGSQSFVASLSLRVLCRFFGAPAVKFL